MKLERLMSWFHLLGHLMHPFLLLIIFSSVGCECHWDWGTLQQGFADEQILFLKGKIVSATLLLQGHGHKTNLLMKC